MPCIVHKITYSRVFKISMTAIMIYGYSRFIITSYCYAQQFCDKVERKRISKLIIKQPKHLTNCLLRSNSISKIMRLKNVANSQGLILC